MFHVQNGFGFEAGFLGSPNTAACHGPGWAQTNGSDGPGKVWEKLMAIQG